MANADQTVSATWTPIAVTGVTLSQTSAELTAGGDALVLTPTVAPDDAKDKTVKWSVGQTGSIVALYTDEACTQAVGTAAIAAAKVYVKPLAAGTATVTGTTNDGAKTATCTVTVAAPAETDIVVTPTANANQWTFTMPESEVELEPEYCTDLLESNDGLLLASLNGKTADIWLGRTLQTGGWNTFCVPFNIDPIPTGWTVKELTSSSLEGGTLTLTFGEATSIEAGKPYLVKVDAAVANPTFDLVTISNSMTTTTSTYADFVPVFSPTNLTGGDKNVLFVTGGNKLTYPAADGNINGFRAYFQLKGDAVSQARAFRMSFGDASGIEDIYDLQIDDLRFASGTYKLDGRRINGQPTQKGVYIVNGKKTVVR